MNLVKKLAVIAALMGATMAAQAGPIFNYNGTCAGSFLSNCGALGLSSGDAVGGFIELEDNALTDMIVEASEITSYVMEFGAQVLSNLNSVVSGALTLAPNGFTLLPGVTAEALVFTQGGNDFGITGSASVGPFSVEGWIARDGGCGFLCNPFAGGPGEFTLAVPEPSVFALMALGLVGLGLVRRKRA